METFIKDIYYLIENIFCGRKRKRMNKEKQEDDFIENKVYLAKNSLKYQKHKHLEKCNLHSIIKSKL